jgi:hypothetical protein
MPDPTQMPGYQWIILVALGVIYLGVRSWFVKIAETIATKEHIGELTRLAKKAENAATKEDIGELTRLVEEVQAEYSRDLERLKSVLLKDVESHRIRYETELDTYQKIWPAAHRLLVAANALEMPTLQGGPGQMQAIGDSRRAFHKAYSVYEEALMELRPFYPDEVYNQLLALGHAVLGMVPPSITDDAWFARVQAERAKLKGLVDGMCDTIRNRLHAASLEVTNRPPS